MAIESVEISNEQAALLLKSHEGHFLDLKGIEVAPATLTKAVSAFANAAGGELYVGIDERFGDAGLERVWRGFQNPEAANGLIQALEGISPLGNHFHVQFLFNAVSQGLVVHITIFKGRDILAASNGKIYVRRAAQSLPVEGDAALQRLRFDKGLASFEDETVDLPPKEIANSETVIDFMLNVVPSAEPETWLEKQRVVVEGRATVAGVLLFSDEPQAVLPKRSAVKIFRYKTKEEKGERDTLAFDPISIEGPTYDMIYDAVDKAREVIESIQKVGASGMEAISYPPEALHEIVTNAVLHRDYSIAADIQVRIFDNRVEIESPGKFPGHVTTQNVLSEQFARNPKLVRLINKFPDAPNKDVGEGLNTAFEAMEKLRLKEPVIEERESSVLVVLRHESLGSPEQLILDYLTTHEEITNPIARDLTGIKSENVVKRAFYRLRDRGLLEPVPGKRGKNSAWRRKSLVH